MGIDIILTHLHVVVCDIFFNPKHFKKIFQIQLVVMIIAVIEVSFLNLENDILSQLN